MTLHRNRWPIKVSPPHRHFRAIEEYKEQQRNRAENLGGDKSLTSLRRGFAFVFGEWILECLFKKPEFMCC